VTVTDHSTDLGLLFENELSAPRVRTGAGFPDGYAAEAVGRGRKLLFADHHPDAGGPAHYAAYLDNEDGFEVELMVSGP
jgi:hypothetical protein